jgi:membrane protein DedA with SNARE-associated domain
LHDRDPEAFAVDTAALWKYLGVLGTLLAAGMGLPIPEELPIATAGAMVGHDSSIPVDALDYEFRLRWWIMLPMCIVGVVAGDGILYTIGRLWGFRVLNFRWVRTRLLPPAKRERIEHNFHRYGIWILLAARLMPGLRGPIFLMAGINRLPLTKFLTADLLYAIPGVSTLFFLAYVFTDQFVAVVKRIDGYRPQIIMCVIALAVGYLIRYFQEHPVSTGDPEDVPVIGQKLATSLTHGEPADPLAKRKEGLNASPSQKAISWWQALKNFFRRRQG